MEVIVPGKFRVWNQVFFEEYLEFKRILSLFGLRKIDVLDLGCGNWRMRVLVDEFWDANYTWVDNTIFDIQYSGEFIYMDIVEYIEQCEKKFDFIILSWIFTNFLDFDKEVLSKIIDLLKKEGALYISLWNYWDDKLYRSDDLGLLEKYLNENIYPKLVEVWMEFELKLYTKIKNGWFNVVITIKL